MYGNEEVDQLAKQLLKLSNLEINTLSKENVKATIRTFLEENGKNKQNEQTWVCELNFMLKRLLCNGLNHKIHNRSIRNVKKVGLFNRI